MCPSSPIWLFSLAACLDWLGGGVGITNTLIGLITVVVTVRGVGVILLPARCGYSRGPMPVEDSFVRKKGKSGEEECEKLQARGEGVDSCSPKIRVSLLVDGGSYLVVSTLVRSCSGC